MYFDSGRPCKKVYQFDYETHELIDEYVSVEEAGFDNYVKAGSIRTAISKNKGVIKTPNGKTIFGYEKKYTTNGN